MSDEERLQVLWDERLIRRTMLDFAHSLDVADWDLHASCFTDPVSVDFSRFVGLDEVRLHPTLWTRFARLILSTAPRHHLLGTFAIQVDGDRAAATVDMISSLWSPSENGDTANRQYGWFDVWFVRQNDTWKISRIRHDYRGVDGHAASLDDHRPDVAALVREVFSEEHIAAARAHVRVGTEAG